MSEKFNNDEKSQEMIGTGSRADAETFAETYENAGIDADVDIKSNVDIETNRNTNPGENNNPGTNLSLIHI